MRVLRHAAVCVALLAAAPARASDEDAEVARLRASAKAALASGQAADAKRDLLRALSVRPASIEVLSDLVDASGTDADERELWALRLAAVTTDVTGELVGVAPNSAAAKAASAHGRPLALARAQVVAALAKGADKLSGPADSETALFVQRAARCIAGPDTALRESIEPHLLAAITRTAPSTDGVIARLRAEVAKARNAGRSDTLIGARALRGLGAQRRRMSGGVALDPLETEAIAVIDAVRAERWAKAEPLTVEDLRAIPLEQRRAWETAHSTWDSPALVVSPKGHYLIESVQGPRTTLMVALDIDGVHERLAKWIGRDPFAGRPGTLRLVRDVIDMEAEGQTLVWARGFNAGEVTTMPGGPTIRRWMSRGYSHEQTHRFDGELYGWLPGWLREGRANWAQVTDTWVGATELDERAVGFDMLGRAKFAGYGDASKLATLLDAKPANPQDDYDVGYSLWLYLSRFRRDWYGPRIDSILTGQRALGTRGAKDLFVSQMCDGKDGRPASLEALARDFQTFLDEASAAKPVGWAKEWQDASRLATHEADKKRAAPVPGAKELDFAGDEEVFDLSNHAPVRTRSAAPAFGATHAYTAATFLEAMGDAEGARIACAWDRFVDEPTRESLHRMAAFHERTGNVTAAWLLNLEASRMSDTPPGPPPAPVAKLQVAVAPLTKALVREADALSAARCPRAAAAIVAEAARIGEALGVEGGPVPPGLEPAELLVPAGMSAAAWAPAKATAGATPWCVRGPYDLIVGRAAPSARDEPTTASDVAQRAVFVETKESFDCGYTIRTRVRPLSTASPPTPWSPAPAIVLGKTSDDRGLTVNLVTGSFFTWKDGSREFTGVEVQLDDQRAADWGAVQLQAHTKIKPGTSFDLVLTVEGSYVLVEIDGRALLSFRTATELPLAGRVGFLVPSGASPVEFQDLRVERHTHPPSAVLDLAADVTVPFEGWDGRRVQGLPRDPLGTLLLIPPDSTATTLAAVVASAAKLLGSADHSARIHVALFRGRDGKPPAEAAAWESVFPGCVHTHAGLSGADEIGDHALWLLIDGEGVVRSHGALYRFDLNLELSRTLLHRLRGW